MTQRETSFEPGKWYHCYNRSIEGRPAFTDLQEYRRFLELLYLANDTRPLRRHDLGTRKLEEIVTLPRDEEIVRIAALCLMPGHFHLVLTGRKEGGVTTFMRKLGTAYTSYFNSRHSRVGNLFLKPFQSIPIDTPGELASVINYVHCNPTSLIEPEWRRGHVVDQQFVEEHLVAYSHSSLNAHRGARTVLRAILDRETLSEAHSASIQEMLSGAQQYYTRHPVP